MGRPKGTPNKNTGFFREELERLQFSIPSEAIALYKEGGLAPFMKVKLLELMASYAHAKPQPVEDPDDPMAKAKAALLGIPSEVIIEALRITAERNKGKP